MKILHQWTLATLLSIVAVGSQAQAPSPNAVIQEAADLLASSLENRKDELEADREALYSVIDGILLPRFDRTYAAQLVLGRTWRDATEEQRERFIDAFYNSLLRKYADGLLQYDQNRIEILPFRGDETKPRVIVKTLVTLDDGTEVPVDYGLVKRDSGWLVFDVTIEGISYVRNFRAELDSEVAATSLDAVIERLEREASATRPE